MSKKTVIAAVAIFALLFSITNLVQVRDAKAQSRTIVVPTDYPTIQDAINSAANGDTIFIKKGTYVENPTVNRSISLVGEDLDTTVIDVTAGLKVEGNNSTITGLTLYDGWRGISLSASYCNISGNKITDSTNGIVLFGCEGNSITGNIFTSIGTSSAVQLNFANRNLVSNNIIDSCIEGIQIWQNSNNNTIRENTITNCQETAVGFQYSSDNIIIQNNITRCKLGTGIYGSNRNIISYNNYFYNAVQFSANEDYYLTFGYNRSINIIDRNYWSDYIGADSNSDGIGDMAYIIDAFNQDNSPLMSQMSFLTATPSPSPSPSLAISILSPANNSVVGLVQGNNTFPIVSFPLIYKTNQAPSWVGYSVDGIGNETVTHNDTIVYPSVLAYNHNLTLYANDTLGNWAIPQTIYFSIGTNLVPATSTSGSLSPSEQPTITPSPRPSPPVYNTGIEIMLGILVLFLVLWVTYYYFKKTKKQKED
jgi:parallel beta-helix repeat protein